jgi:SNF family Na+-dependent transporter
MLTSGSVYYELVLDYYYKIVYGWVTGYVGTLRKSKRKCKKFEYYKPYAD